MSLKSLTMKVLPQSRKGEGVDSDDEGRIGIIGFHLDGGKNLLDHTRFIASTYVSYIASFIVQVQKSVTMPVPCPHRSHFEHSHGR